MIMLLRYLLIIAIGVFCVINTFIYPIRINTSIEKEIELSKADNPDEYYDFYDRIRTREGDARPRYQQGYKEIALKKALQTSQNLRLTTHEPPVWESLGPANVPGRTRAILVDVSDPTGNTWFAGTAGGGIWKTSTGGVGWINKTPEIPNLATNSIVQSPSNPDVMYAGSGEGYGIAGSIKGDGIYKSIDHGDTWNLLTSTLNDYRFENINRIIIDPDDENILLVCTNTHALDPQFFSGILKSLNGGTTWQLVYEGSSPVQQLIHHPSDFNIQYATQFANTVLKTEDAGETWVPASTGLVSGGRIELAIAFSDPNRLYAATEGNTIIEDGSELFVSYDAGQSWSMLREVNSGENFNWFGGQGFHNNSLVVNPLNENEIYVGGIDLHKMKLEAGQAMEGNRLLNVFEINSVPFLGWINWGGGFLGGGFDTGEKWFSSGSWTGYPENFSSSDMVSVEIRFGNGLTQMAHRFIVDPISGSNNDGGAGVSPLGHHYADYVEVPFQVWDIDNNIQLMVSFRDQERDGKFNLNERDDNDVDLLNVREYIFIHAISYDPANPNPNITKDGGHGYKNIYSMWPKLRRGSIWNPLNLPDSKVQAIYGPLMIGFKSTINLTSAKGILSLNTVHPDHHNIIPILETASTFKLLDANDGGIYLSDLSTNPGVGDSKWVKASNQMVTGQFYGIDKKPLANIYIGGLQDNGVWLSGQNPNQSANYTLKIGGDGGEVVWNYRNPDKVITSNQYNRLFISTDAGANWSTVSGYPDKGVGNAPFITRIGNSKVAPDLIYLVGSSGVSRSADFGNSWTTTAINNQWSSGTITSTYNIEVSDADYKVIWAGGAMSSAINIHVSSNGGNTFSPVTKYSLRTLGPISGIATHPYEPNTAYLLFSLARTPKVLRTKDLGVSWEDISGYGTDETSSNGFPDVATYCLFVHPVDPNIIWAGTEIGIFESIDDGVSWHFQEGNLPSASIWQIKAVDDKVIVATHGRGLWAAQIDGLQWPENVVVGINKEELSVSANFYPNPASDFINVDFDSPSGKDYVIRLIDAHGRVVRYVPGRSQDGKQSEKIDLDNLSNGIYIVSIEMSGKSESGRIVVIK